VFFHQQGFIRELCLMMKGFGGVFHQQGFIRESCLMMKPLVMFSAISRW
jgi:hypothetical protein